MMTTTNNIWNTNKVLLNALTTNQRIIQRVMNNNTFLLQVAGTSVNEQLRQIAERTGGFKISKTRMSILKSGRDKKINITILSLLANYWDLQVEDMMTKEMWLGG